MKTLLTLALTFLTLCSPAFAGQKVQFDAEVRLYDSESDRIFIHKDTYTAEFQPVDGLIRDTFEDILVFRKELPLTRPSNGEVLTRNFGLEIYRYVKGHRSGKVFSFSADIGSGQPINKSTRWFDIQLKDLSSFTGFSLYGEEVNYPEKDGRRPMVSPVLEVTNFKVLD